MTWKENSDKAYLDKQNGVLAKELRAVEQLDTQGTILNVFHSMCEAERNVGVPQPNIWKVCNGLRKTAGGYAWKYKKQEIK